MKIVLVGRYGEGEILSGPERVARELFSELKRKNIEVIFFEYFFSGYKGTSLFKKLFGKKYIEDQSILRLGILPLILIIVKDKFEIIHIVNSQRFILFLLILKPFIAGKFVTTLHGSMAKEIPKSKFWRKRFFIDLWVEKLVLNNSTLLVFPSSLLYNIFNIQYGIPNKIFQIIPNGISKIFYNNARQFPQIKDSIKLVFYNGSDSSINRGLAQLLQILKRVKCNIKLFIIGDNVISASSDPKNIFTAVPLLSHRKLIEFLSDKHFIVKSNAFDTFSVFVAECMSLGLIPIVHENIGIRDFIKNEVNGFTYKGNTEEELPILIDNISKDWFDLERISTNAKNIFNELNWSEVTKKYLTAYKSIR
jgi:glycosyltransferase involved in cell wall biosynthesis